jgi:hypothetical protein
MEQFQTVKEKMKNAGINVNLDVINRAENTDSAMLSTKPSDELMQPTDTHANTQADIPADLPESSMYPNVNMRHIEYLPSDLPLKSYHFEINLNEHLSYFISFNLFHKTA